MSIETSFEKEYRITTGKGHLTFEDIEANMYAIIENEKYKPNTNAIIDFSDAQLLLSMDGLKKVAGAAESLRVQIGQCKWAIVTSDDSIVEAARLFKTLASHSDVEIMVFKEIDDAKYWIGVDPD